MFVLTWTAMFLLVGVGNAEEDALVWGKEYCQKENFCITLPERVTGEAGLCAVIPCSFKTEFQPQHMIWHKCRQNKKNCQNPDVIFNSNINKPTGAEFKGRVSLLEPDVNQRNCSIMINDITQSDSGDYHLRVTGIMKEKSDAFSFTGKITSVNITGLNQKPTVTIPLLTEGQQATLTCTAPGLCSGSPPKITWMWGGKGEDYLITGNVTALKAENLTAVTQRHSSTLTFNLSAEDHNIKLTCKVSLTGGTTSQETETLNVTYARKPRILGRTTVKEGNDLNLTCSVESFPPSQVKFSRKLKSSDENVLQEEHGLDSYYISNMTTEDAGLYICTAKHLNKTLTEQVNVTVTWFSGILNDSGCVLQSKLICVCISEGFPKPNISWRLLMNHTEYSVSDIVSDQAVSSTVMITVKGQENISVECFSRNENGEAKKKLAVLKHFSDESTGTVPWLEILIVCLIVGFIFVLISFKAIKCYRKKLKKSGNSAETLEGDPQFCHGQTVNKAPFQVQQGAVNGTLAPELNSRSNDVTYASIDLSVLNRSLREVENRMDKDNEYAKVKREKKMEDDAEEKKSEED